jgi:hypothetical protein
MSNILEGKGVPTITFNSKTYKLPIPKGPDRASIKQFDFPEVNKGQFFSEGQKLVTVGKKFQFAANLSWEPVNKVTLKILQLAAKQSTVEFVLNEDKSSIKFNVKVSSPKYRLSQGLAGNYAITVQMTGTELLDAPGYDDLEITGYGIDYGSAPGTQSP